MSELKDDLPFSARFHQNPWCQTCKGGSWNQLFMAESNAHPLKHLQHWRPLQGFQGRAKQLCPEERGSQKETQRGWEQRCDWRNRWNWEGSFWAEEADWLQWDDEKLYFPSLPDQ